MITKHKFHIINKWLKTKILLKNQHLINHIPRTELFNENELKSMLDTYHMVYIKPEFGTFGNGVMRVEQVNNTSDTAYCYQTGTKLRKFNSYTNLYRSIEKRKLKRKYIVQQGIHLMEYQKRRFDIRVMVQKNSLNKWEPTGVIGRLSHPDKIVTNYHSGGKPMSIYSLFRPSMPKRQIRELSDSLKKFSCYIAKKLSSDYPGINMIGVDIGVDKQYKPWIIEVNTNPDPFIFNKLKNQATFRKVYRYAKKLGRV